VKLRTRACVVASVAALELSIVGTAHAQTEAYVALAFAPSTSVTAFVAANSLDEAKRGALFRCSQSGAGDCRVPVWAHNGWVAIAGDGSFQPSTPAGPWGTGWGYSQQVAHDNAVTICQQNGGRTCADHGSQRTPAFDPNQRTEGGGG
jgi:hypothetical protein